MASFVLFLVSLAVAASAQGWSVESFQPKSGFVFVGTTEGKIFLAPILPEEQRYGVSWQEALSICVSGGYRMATIESQAQDDVVKAYMTEGLPGIDVTRWSWIDGTSFISRGDWFSLNTGKNLTFFNWVPGRPIRETVTDPYAESCRCLRWSHNSGEYEGMWDIPCTDKHNVICQTEVQ